LLNQLFKLTTGIALLLGPFFNPVFSEEIKSPISSPTNTEYPGIIETFESLVQIDAKKFKSTNEILLKENKILADSSKVQQLELQPDFLNSIILHSNPGYIRIASSEKCRFYDAILADLLRSAEGKIKNVMVTYINPKGARESTILSKKDFLTNVVNRECPKTIQMIDQFQIKTLKNTLDSIIFEVPTNIDQCRISHLSWQNNPKTPYLCQLHEYIQDAKKGNNGASDFKQKQMLAKVIESKLSLTNKDYLENLCTNLDNEKAFCDKFLNISFWNKISGQLQEKIYINEICKNIQKTQNLSENDYRICLNRIKNEPDLCLFNHGKFHHLTPSLDCEALSIALNHSSLKSNYDDCPGSSDQLAATNLSRVLLNLSPSAPGKFNGPCSVISAGETTKFREKFNDDENWSLQACYDHKLKEREVCENIFFGNYEDHPKSLTSAVARILIETRGAEKNLKCNMISSETYNPMLLEFKTGCHIIYNKYECLQSQCNHKILYNDRPITFIRIKGRSLLEYFPLNMKTERFALQYLFKNDFKQSVSQISNLTFAKNFFKKSEKKLLYGVGCAADLLPGYFKVRTFNQCSPLPFIIDGLVKDGEDIAFVIRTAADSLQTPRLISWPNIFSGVKSYQMYHPLNIWTLYGLN